MSKRVSLLALLCCLCAVVLLLSLARVDLSRVPADASPLELRHSLSYQESSLATHTSKQQLLAFIGVQVSQSWNIVSQLMAWHQLYKAADRIHNQHRSQIQL